MARHDKNSFLGGMFLGMMGFFLLSDMEDRASDSENRIQELEDELDDRDNDCNDDEDFDRF